jgi:threonine synthase
MWRYHDLLPIHGAVTDGPGWTPLVHVERLSDALGVELLLKLESANPTFSFKDRVAAVARAVAVEHGIGTLCCSSTGNLGDAVAAAGAAASLETIILAPRGEPAAGAIAHAAGARVIAVDGTYDDCRRLELELATLFPWGFLASSLHPFAVEGMKTVAYEIAEQLDWALPDAVVCPAGSGALVSKLAQAFGELRLASLTDDDAPRLVAAQSERCAPIAGAFADNRPISRVRPQTTVDAIAIGDPAYGDLAIGAARASGGAVVAVPDDEAETDAAFLARTTGVVADTATGIAFAGLLQAIRDRTIEPGSRVVLVVTGAGLKELVSAPAPMDAIPPEAQLILTQLGLQS